MVAMILAAGLGTRLRPLTNDTPKALVPVANVPMLERVVRRCLDAGATRLVVNVSYLGEQVADFIEANDGFGVDVQISDEPDGPLETGGGIKKAAPLLPDDAPVLVHNADILTSVDLRALYAAHVADDRSPLATLAVTPAESGRYLVFDDGGLAGYAIDGEEKLMRDRQGTTRRYDFCGVHVVSREMVDMLCAEDGEKFSVMDSYLRAAKHGRVIAAFEGGHTCHDVGTHERLEEAGRLVTAWEAEGKR
ncbi:MAG: nucleotidyltransferase family protein [Rhodothermales bacterium]